MSEHQHLPIILQVVDEGDKNVETQPNVKSESTSYVGVIKLQRLIQ